MLCAVRMRQTAPLLLGRGAGTANGLGVAEAEAAAEAAGDGADGEARPAKGLGLGLAAADEEKVWAAAEGEPKLTAEDVATAENREVRAGFGAEEGARGGGGGAGLQSAVARPVRRTGGSGLRATKRQKRGAGSNQSINQSSTHAHERRKLGLTLRVASEPLHVSD